MRLNGQIMWFMENTLESEQEAGGYPLAVLAATFQEASLCSYWVSHGNPADQFTVGDDCRSGSFRKAGNSVDS